MTALLQHWEDSQTSGNTPLETPCWALDWKYEHIVSVLSRSIYDNNKQSRNETVNSPGTLLICFHLIPLPSLALFLLITLSLPFSLWWTADLYILQYYQSNSSGCGWLRKCWHNRYVCVHCGSVLSVLEYYKKKIKSVSWGRSTSGKWFSVCGSTRASLHATAKAAKTL